MSRTLNVIGVLLVLALGAGLYQLKLEVEERDRALDELYRAHLDDQKAIRVLEAEWAYLNSPEHLQGLAVRHLRLSPILPTQVLDDIDAIPFRPGKRPGPDGSMTPHYPIPKAKPQPHGASTRAGAGWPSPQPSNGVPVAVTYPAANAAEGGQK